MRQISDYDLYALAETADRTQGAPQLRATRRRAFVVFTGQADLPWLRLLKAGYRHCFILLQENERWISVDPLLNRMEVQTHDLAPGFDLALWLRGRGYRVVETEVSRDRVRPMPFAAFTCVEAVKRVLGLHAPLVLTPWQLFRHLERRSSPAIAQGGLAWAA